MIYFLNSLPDHFFVMISKIDMPVLENLEKSWNVIAMTSRMLMFLTYSATQKRVDGQTHVTNDMNMFQFVKINSFAP